MAPVDDLAKANTLLTRLATADLLDWWETGNRYDRSPDDLIDFMSEPFYALTLRWGEQATEAAVDYLILQRSLDDELRWLPTPTRAEKIAYGEAQSALEWAVNTSKKQGSFNSLEAKKKLLGATTRLVMKSGRHTIIQATKDAGTRYARIPEPGACPFCLMLASRGAVYLESTVAATKDMSKFHDHCRCIGVEGGKTGDPFAGLPPVNRELREVWDINVGIDTHQEWTAGDQRRHWRNVIIHKRRMKLREVARQARANDPDDVIDPDSPVRWPPVRGIKTPTYSLTARQTTFGKPEPLPDLEHMPGHVLFGWKDNDPLPPLADEIADYGRAGHTLGDQFGHRFSSIRPKATLFPQSWSDQKIVDAVRDTIEDPDEYVPVKGRDMRRRVRREIDGVLVDVSWKIGSNGEAVFINAFPVRGKGVKYVDESGNVVGVLAPHAKDHLFVPVRR